MFYLVASEVSGARDDKQFSIFNVIKFPNDPCVGSGSLNGTCYTSTECTSLGGTSSGSCSSGFGVCCVFSLSCGGSTSANTSYAMITSWSSTDADPCTYSYCKNNDDVCKLRSVKKYLEMSLLMFDLFPRIDYEALVIAGPDTMVNADTTKLWIDGVNIGSCNTDSLTGLEK